jgi:hypothetical protein
MSPPAPKIKRLMGLFQWANGLRPQEGRFGSAKPSISSEHGKRRWRARTPRPAGASVAPGEREASWSAERQFRFGGASHPFRQFVPAFRISRSQTRLPAKLFSLLQIRFYGVNFAVRCRGGGNQTVPLLALSRREGRQRADDA